MNRNVSSCLIGSMRYKPGDVFEVEPEQYVSHIMTAIAEPSAVVVPAEVAEPVEDVPVEEKSAKKTRKKKAEMKPV